MKAKWFSIFSLVLVLAVALSAVGPASAQSGNGGGLSKHERELLAEAVANGYSTVTLLIASAPGANNKVASGIQKLGGTVRYREDDINYISAVIPVDKVEAAFTLSGVQAVDLNEVIPLDDPRPDVDEGAEGVVGIISQSVPNASTPRENPYMPTRDIGAAQFVNANPTWDGRGVTIGIVDSGVTLDHPSLQTTSTGERKIIDWVTATDPFADGDPTWISMQDQVSGSSFVYNSVSYTGPANGSYRIGLFNERNPNLGGEVGSDVNRDGNPAGSSGIFAVLWNADNGKVWVESEGTGRGSTFYIQLPRANP